MFHDAQGQLVAVSMQRLTRPQWRNPIEKSDGSRKYTMLGIHSFNLIYSGRTLEMVQIDAKMMFMHAIFAEISAENRGHRKRRTDCTDI